MAGRLSHNLSKLGKQVYFASEKRVIGRILPLAANSYEQAKIKLLFDYLFFALLISVPIICLLIVQQDYIGLLSNSLFCGVYVVCLLLIRNGRTTEHVGMLAAYTTMLFAIVSSILNEWDLGPMFSVSWLLGILLGYVTVNLRTAIMLVGILFIYLCIAAYVKITGIEVYTKPGYSIMNTYIATPLLTIMFIFLLLRVWGLHYRNVILLAREESKENQKQFSARINQNLIKQFILVKGLSRSGKSKYLDGSIELMECLSEIERQCDTAINYLDQEPANTNPAATTSQQ